MTPFAASSPFSNFFAYSGLANLLKEPGKNPFVGFEILLAVEDESDATDALEILGALQHGLQSDLGGFFDRWLHGLAPEVG